MINIDDTAQQRRLNKTNISDFKSNFGRHPLHLCRMWRDLQTTNIVEAFMPEDEARSPNGLKGFLMACHFCKTHGTVSVRASHFGGADRALCGILTWRFVFRFSALISFKVVWPDHFDETCIGSLDGTVTATNEPRDPNERRNSKNYAKKVNGAGRNHEIVVDLWRSRCIHAKMSDQGSVHDLTAMRQELVNKIPPGKRIIVDKGYITFVNDEHLFLAFANPLDCEEVKLFKKEARARHENFNKRLKDYKCLKNCFIHGIEKEMACFYAVVVMVQYAIEDTGPVGEPLNRL